MKDKTKIPEGPYCYHGTRSPSDKNYEPCPYWSIREDKPPQNNGYCSYLEKGDWEMECGLLWDQVKECGLNKKKFFEKIKRARKALRGGI